MNKIQTLSVAVLGLGMIVVAGCGNPSEFVAEQAIKNATGGKADVQINGNEIKVKTDQGETQWGGAAKLPDSWPTDAPVYAGAKVTFSGANTQSGGQGGSMVILTTNDKGADVFAYYQKELANQGWKIDGTYQAGTMATLAATKDNRTMSVSVAASDTETTITMAVGTK